MKKAQADDVLRDMIAWLLLYVEELSCYTNKEKEQFQYGERVAYTECLEMLQQWTHAEECGLDFNIEEKYPL